MSTENNPRKHCAREAATTAFTVVKTITSVSFPLGFIIVTE